MPADRFCDRCDVDLGLHPSEDSWGCDAAIQKADLMDRFFGMFVPQRADYFGSYQRPEGGPS